MSDSEKQSDADTVSVRDLERAANNTPVDRKDTLALAVALADGEVSEEEATEAFEVLKRDQEAFFQDYYPGDNAYDRADVRYGGIY